MPISENPGGGASGDPAATETLSIAKAAQDGTAEGAARSFALLENAAVGGVKPSDTAPHIKITLPAGKTLETVTDSVDGEINFTREGATQSWLSDDDFDGTRRILLILTR